MIITCWLNSIPDPHYGSHRPADMAELATLSTLGVHRSIVLSDCLTPGSYDNAMVVRVEPLGGNPYFDRWRHVARYLRDAALDLPFVWVVDAGDVRLLNHPYPTWLINGSINYGTELVYVGSEPTHGDNARSVGFWWVKATHPGRAAWIDANADRPLLNPGILGGHRYVVRDFAFQVARAERSDDVTDMAAANKLLYGDEWCGRFITGERIHTPMWSFATSDPHAIWAHK